MKEKENLDDKRSGLLVKKESSPETAIKVGGITEMIESEVCATGLRCDVDPARWGLAKPEIEPGVTGCHALWNLPPGA